MASKIKSLIHTRAYVRSRITRTYDEVQHNLLNFDKVKVTQFITKLNDDSANVKTLDDQIVLCIWIDTCSDEDNAEAQTKELDNVSTYKDKLNESLRLLNDRLATLNSGVAKTKLKPETAPLPTYGGERDESLEKFIFSFEAITSVHQYSEFEKFLLLQKCMTGRAKILISSLEVDKQSYSDAKTLLQQAFAAPLAQKYNALERLVDLKFFVNKDPLFLVSEMRQIKEAFNRLKIDINLVLQFFYWRALPETIKTQLVTITND
jgi:hypothetical protein